MHQLQRSWVRSQHPSAQWNLRGGRWSSAEYCKKKKKIPPKNTIKKTHKFKCTSTGTVPTLQDKTRSRFLWQKRSISDLAKTFRIWPNPCNPTRSGSKTLFSTFPSVLKASVPPWPINLHTKRDGEKKEMDHLRHYSREAESSWSRVHCGISHLR